MSLGNPDNDIRPVHYGNVTIYNWIPNRFEFLKACDVVIGRAGHGTITQAMCYGKPIILIPPPGHTEQISNAKQAQDLGVAKIVLQEDLSKGKLLKTVAQLLEGEASERLRIIQEEVQKYDGLEIALEAIAELAGR